MKMLNILHISDAHVEKKHEKQMRKVFEELILDVRKVQDEEKIKIDLVCFTGDLIQRGDKALSDERQLELAQEILVKPLLNELKIEKDNFLYVPGNHEVDITKIDKVIERGLTVNSLEEINENTQQINTSYYQRLSYFYEVVKEHYENIIEGEIGYAFIRNIKGCKIGVACIDSSWRSSGKGECEKGLLYVGQKQVRDLFNHIEETDLKICLMHHPLDWLSDYEANLIEKEMTKFDIVLNGHVHANDNKVICRQNVRTIYSTAGKLFPLDYAQGRAIDGYNGYSILNIDLEKQKCNIFIRTFFAKERFSFDRGIDMVENGVVSYALNDNLKEKQIEFDIIKGVREYFKQMSEKFCLINEIDAQSPISIEQVFVDPILSEKSEYIKENQEEDTLIKIDEIWRDSSNLIITGKKESGKTTILQKIGLLYIENYEKREVIPIHIDMRYLPKREKMLNATIHFVLDHMLENDNINKVKIRNFLEDGKYIFLIDSVDITDSSQTYLLYHFISQYKKNRFILAIKEEFFQALDIKKIPNYGTEFKQIYIHNLGKQQIRQLVTRWVSNQRHDEDINEIVEKIDGYCNQINFPKTPFNISIIMVILDFNRNFSPQNEGIVMRNYLEILLERLSLEESYRSNYSFAIKEDFLSNLAYKMFTKGKFYLTEQEFENFVYDYHMNLGYLKNDTKFDVLFFEKGILSKLDDNIIFSYTSVLEYFLAIYASKNEDFLKYMIAQGNRINFKNEICFYSGINPNCGELLTSMSRTIVEEILKNLDVVDNLNNLEIMADFKISKEDLVHTLNENRLTQNEIDEICDISHEKKEVSPLEIKKTESQNIESLDLELANGNEECINSGAEDFYSLVQMYGSVLKNAELIDNTSKIMHLENYMCAMNIFLGEILQFAKIWQQELTQEDFKEELKDSMELTQEEFEVFKEKFLDVIKLTFPIAVQNMILENVGTPKLESAINILLKEKSNKPFERFMFNFLKSDLKIGKIMHDLDEYIKSEQSESILKLILTKLIFYYKMRFFGVDKRKDDNLLDLMLAINVKLNPEKEKEAKKALKQNKQLIRKELAEKLK